MENLTLTPARRSGHKPVGNVLRFVRQDEIDIGLANMLGYDTVFACVYAARAAGGVNANVGIAKFWLVSGDVYWPEQSGRYWQLREQVEEAERRAEAGVSWDELWEVWRSTVCRCSSKKFAGVGELV